MNMIYLQLVMYTGITHSINQHLAPPKHKRQALKDAGY